MRKRLQVQMVHRQHEPFDDVFQTSFYSDLPVHDDFCDCALGYSVQVRSPHEDKLGEGEGEEGPRQEEEKQKERQAKAIANHS